MKRLFDLIIAFVGLLMFSPILLPVMFLIWRQDYNSPFYIAPRVGKDGRLFNMIKLRSMIKNADKSGVDSTSATDMRITPIGHFVRRYKLDELTQLWNVLRGEMSLVGPRPNVQRETELYTRVEKRLLTVKPGITDIASIVFSDEGEILSDCADPDLSYNQLIRPGKSSLGLFYIDNQSLLLDIQLCIVTAVAIVSRNDALEILQNILKKRNASHYLCSIAYRRNPLVPTAPPGSDKIVTSRDEQPMPLSE